MIEALLKKLSESSGVSGHEDRVRALVRTEMEKYADKVWISRLGSVVALKRGRAKNGKFPNSSKEERPRVLLEGHMDEIGLVVTNLERGFIRFDEIGGFDVRVLLGQQVVVHGRRDLPGLIGSRAPHVFTEAERTKAVPMDKLFVDVGLPEEKVSELVQVGDTITIARRVVNLKGGLLAGKAFDDRAAVVTVIDALRQLQALAHPWDVYAVSNVQEEDGAFFAGATTTTFEIRPDVAIALDVNHADQPGVNEMNVTPLREGPGIARGPNIHPLIHERLVKIAQDNEIPHRVTVYPGATGTNAWAMQVVAEGIPTGLIDLPLRYMHTSVETLSVDDLERASRLLAQFVASLDDEFAKQVRGEMIPVTGEKATRKKTIRARRKK